LSSGSIQPPYRTSFSYNVLGSCCFVCSEGIGCWVWWFGYRFNVYLIW